ncbi:MAG: UvrD-helicase domain-containing protein [Spirochaetes bacterium]|nr:UvrD-helicase domain-containing protein [Spirochaetota bacterium]
MHIDFRAELNPEQYAAVSSVEGPLLIIAGAGSGKTRVITFRIAFMLEKGIPQSSILALTFTNKAAREMAGRVREVTNRKLQNLTCSTFHAFGVKILRKEIDRLGWRENFSIYDEVDRRELIKECARELGFKMETFDLNAAGIVFSNVKTLRADWAGENDLYRKVYEEYEASLKAYNALDFDDLILKPIEVFERFPEVRELYRERFRYIMIDEFQDTSLLQYRIMKLLADDNVCVVGDDDQSIYSWRGANYENIMQFEAHWPHLKQVMLERNYRSTSTILDAANSVIANNSNRKPKALWSPSGTGTPIEVLAPADETEEADFIARTIKAVRVRESVPFKEFGVLVRINSLTRWIEEAFLAQGVPYRVSGGNSFFQRKEIKDIVSYLRVAANPDDDMNLIRIVNVPRRGLGRRTLERLTEIARSGDLSLRRAMEAVRDDPFVEFPEKSRGDVAVFLELVDELREELLGRRNLAAKVRKMVDTIDYWSYLVTENPNNEKVATWKLRNIESLVRSIDLWEKDPDTIDPSLYDWLNRISLITRDDVDDEEDSGKVNLMTIHAAKGLEYNVVFIAGCEDGIIPHARSLEEGEGNIEEERRLFYVAITRAKKKLFITTCARRRRQNQVIECVPSPFLSEIPEHLLAWTGCDGDATEEQVFDVFSKMKKLFTASDAPVGQSAPGVQKNL